jgi:hypothetical protein
MPETIKCVDCPKELKWGQRFHCPACRDIRCFACFKTHLESKSCKYGKAEVIDL